MLPIEMHVGIDEGLQYVNSSLYDTILPEEKDWFLNESVLRFCRQRVSAKSNRKQEGFDDTTKRYEDLEELVTDAILTPSVHATEPYCVRSYLPVDFLSLVNDRSSLYYNCNDINIVNSTSTIKYAVVPFPQVSLTPATPYRYYKLKITVGGVDTVLFNMQAAADSDGLFSVYGTTGLPNDNYRFVIVNQLLYHTKTTSTVSTKCTVYWEKYRDIYAKHSFIIVFSNSSLAWSVTWYDEAVPTAQSVTPDTTNVTTQSTRGISYTTKLVPNRITDHEILHNILDSYYYKTIYSSPISAINKGYINVYYNPTFLINSIYIQYLRKPRQISHAINQSCELNPNFHQEIVDMTVQRIKALVQAGNYKEFVQENLLIE